MRPQPKDSRHRCAGMPAAPAVPVGSGAARGCWRYQTTTATHPPSARRNPRDPPTPARIPLRPGPQPPPTSAVAAASRECAHGEAQEAAQKPPAHRRSTPRRCRPVRCSQLLLARRTLLGSRRGPPKQDCAPANPRELSTPTRPGGAFGSPSCGAVASVLDRRQDQHSARTTRGRGIRRGCSPLRPADDSAADRARRHLGRSMSATAGRSACGVPFGLERRRSAFLRGRSLRCVTEPWLSCNPM